MIPDPRVKRPKPKLRRLFAGDNDDVYYCANRYGDSRCMKKEDWVYGSKRLRKRLAKLMNAFFERWYDFRHGTINSRKEKNQGVNLYSGSGGSLFGLMKYCALLRKEEERIILTGDAAEVDKKSENAVKAE